MSADTVVCDVKEGSVDEFKSKGDEVEEKGDEEVGVKSLKGGKEEGNKEKGYEGDDLDEEVGS